MAKKKKGKFEQINEVQNYIRKKKHFTKEQLKKEFNLKEKKVEEIIKELLGDELIEEKSKTKNKIFYKKTDKLIEDHLRKANAMMLEQTLESFGIPARVVEIDILGNHYRYNMEIALGSKLSRIKALKKDLALAVASPTGDIHIQAPIPRRALIGIWVPKYDLKTYPDIEWWRELLSKFLMYSAAILFVLADKISVKKHKND